MDGCYCLFWIERWPRWRDWPEVLCEGVRVWCGEELWISGTGEYLVCNFLSQSKPNDKLCIVSSSYFLLYVTTPFLRFRPSFFFILRSLLSFSTTSTFPSIVSLQNCLQNHLLAILPPSDLILFYHISVPPSPSLFLTCFSTLPSDTGGGVYTVCHDGRDQAELDRGSEKERQTHQLSRPHTVSCRHLEDCLNTNSNLIFQGFSDCKLINPFRPEADSKNSKT